MQKGPRIASLISSGTEIVYRLGAGADLVAISHECDFPPELAKRGLPVLSEPKIDPKKTSFEIDQDVRTLVREGLSVYRIKTEALEAVAPDVIVTQDQCEVCAVSLKDVESAVCQITQRPTHICTLKPHVLDDIADDFRKVGKAVGREAAAEDLVSEFWMKLNAVNARAGSKGQKQPSILCIEWLEPTIIAGGWIPEIVRLAGGEPLIVSGPDHFKKITWQEALASDPDIIAILPCGYAIEKTMEELSVTATRESLAAFRATKEGNCFVCDGNNYFNRPGPRITDTTEILASLLHPNKFPEHVATYRGKAYIPWQP